MPSTTPSAPAFVSEPPLSLSSVPADILDRIIRLTAADARWGRKPTMQSTLGSVACVCVRQSSPRHCDSASSVEGLQGAWSSSDHHREEQILCVLGASELSSIPCLPASEARQTARGPPPGDGAPPTAVPEMSGIREDMGVLIISRDPTAALTRVGFLRRGGEVFVRAGQALSFPYARYGELRVLLRSENQLPVEAEESHYFWDSRPGGVRSTHVARGLGSARTERRRFCLFQQCCLHRSDKVLHAMFQTGTAPSDGFMMSLAFAAASSSSAPVLMVTSQVDTSGSQPPSLDRHLRGRKGGARSGHRGRRSLRRRVRALLRGGAVSRRAAAVVGHPFPHRRRGGPAGWRRSGFVRRRRGDPAGWRRSAFVRRRRRGGPAGWRGGAPQRRHRCEHPRRRRRRRAAAALVRRRAGPAPARRRRSPGGGQKHRPLLHPW